MLWLIVLILCVGSFANADELHVDPRLPQYASAENLTGNITSVGSDTLNTLMTHWAEGFQAKHKTIRFQIDGKGSSTAPPALIEGLCQLAPMSRRMRTAELEAFKKKYGYLPTEIKVAIDTVAVFVHKDNPVSGFTLAQLDGIFSSTLKRSGKNITSWGQLGLKGDWNTRPIAPFGRNPLSGTYAFFKEVALKEGNFRSSYREQAGSVAVVAAISQDPGGIGYSGISYLTPGVRAVPVTAEGQEFYEPDYENALSKKYPLSRFLYIYVNKKPSVPMGKLEPHFFRYVFSKEGQTIASRNGYYPLTFSMAAEALAAVQ